MSDPRDESQAPASAAAEAPDSAPPPAAEELEVAAEQAQRRRRKLRLWAVIALPLLLLLAVLALWLVGDGLLTDRLRAAIEAAGLEPGPTVIEASAIGGRVALVDADLVDRHQDQVRSVYRSPETVVDVAVLDSLLAGAPIVDRVAMRDAVIDLRRFPDGTVPGMPEDPEDEDQPDEAEKPPRDLVELYRQWKERVRKAREWLPEGGEETDAPSDQPVRPAPGWERAVRFYPKPAEPTASPFPRTLVRELDVSGQGVVLPDSREDAPSPLDVATFALTGSNVTTRIEAGEVMELGGEYATVGAGAGRFAFRGEPTGGSLDWSWDAVPLAAVAQPGISGDRLQAYNPDGRAALVIDADWQGQELGGTIELRLIDLTLAPTAAAGPEAGEIARGLDELRQLHARLDPEGPLVIRWVLTLGGSPSEPRITDLGAASFQRALADAAGQLRAAATAKAKAAADEAKASAIEEGKGLIEDVKSGKDVEDSAKERMKNLEGQGDKLKNLFGK